MMKNTQMYVLVTFLILLGSSLPSIGATWMVEKDDSGDFTIIQDAVDAAADGDTLRIGPGRFDDYRRVNLGVWQDRIIHVFINSKSLTMLGSGQGTTIIGPNAEFPITEHDGGCVLVNGADLQLSELTIERCYGALECWDTSALVVERCTFQHYPNWGVGCGVFSPSVVRISDCTFIDYDTGIFPANWSSGLIVEDCEFRSMGCGINTTAAQGMIVSNCRFDDTLLGIQLWASSTATLTNNDIDAGHLALVVKDGSHAELLDSALTSSGLATVLAVGRSSLSGSGNVLQGDGCPSLRIYRSDVSLSGSHLLATGNYTVYCDVYFLADWTVDLRNNWWGLNDADGIEDLIFDGHDSPDVDVLVDYLPFHGQAVSNEAMGWGELKRLYR